MCHYSQSIWYVEIYTDNPSNFLYTCGVNLDRQMLDKTLYIVDNTGINPQLLQSVLSPFFKVGKTLTPSSVDAVFPFSLQI